MTTDGRASQGRSSPRRRPGRTGAALITGAVAMGVAGGVPADARAQSATPGSTVYLEPLTVEGLQLMTEDRSRIRLEAIPGGTGLVATDDLTGKADLSISDTLAAVPGVVVQDFFGGNDQPRIQIRGSGLQQNPVERGVLALQNGLPINRADGSYIVGLANPRQAEVVEIYRGYTANRLGAAMLGGAINFVSPTGTSDPGVEAMLEGGSFGHVKGALQAGGRLGDADGLVRLDHSRRDGYRDYNSSERTSIDANVGLDVTDDVSTRFFAGYTDLRFDVAGPLPKAILESDPDSVHGGPVMVGGQPTNPGPNVLRDRPQRDAEQFHVGNRTSATFGDHLLDGGIGYTHTKDAFRFPIPSGIRETEGGDLTLVARYAYAPDPDAPLPLVDTSLRYVTGSADRRDYINASGERGPLFGSSDLEASTLTLHGGLNLPLGDGFTLSPAITYALATRTNTDTYGAATRPTIAYNPGQPNQRLPDGSVTAGDTSYDHEYSAVSPSLGLSYRPNDDHMVFAAVSRSFEPPTHDDLLATVNGTPNSSAGRPRPPAPNFPAAAYRTPDLDAQTATTIEAGWRGFLGPVGVDAVTYYSWVNDELLSLRDETGASLGAVNADETRHFGVELGVTAHLSDDLSTRLAYTFQDFRFHDDPVRGDNRLAGAPQHVINLTARYAVTEDLAVGAGLDWIPTETPVDNMNTLYRDPYATVDLSADYSVAEGVVLYGEARNIFDATYASSTLIVDQARPDQAAFLPGDGRAFYAGLRVAF
ncbi:TonB-dependent receptor [Caenispirillum salinarum AK4]|uniref:TonB-dependent receptor n=1 Tax=Caenispirillum salinarum AK4 TaxID=1238182 RepID=K9GUQ7_9PROT|nr:TonB-dependent receptor [Caenispirillum salinarum]EKV28957.1 TonB-dependent receptor [Caenispirillum salinarum AK4]